MYLLYGSNLHKIEKTRRSIINLCGIDEFNFNVFDMEETSINKVLDIAYTLPFLTDYRVIVLKNCSFFNKVDKKDDITGLIEYVKKPSDSTVMIFEYSESKVDKNSDLYKYIRTNGDISECKEYDENELNKFLNSELEKNNISMDNEARRILFDRANTNSLNFINEVMKLMIFANQNNHINKELVLKMISKDQSNIFELTSAIIDRKKDLIMMHYYDLVKNGQRPIYILSSIISKFLEILYTKELMYLNSKDEDIIEFFKLDPGNSKTRGKIYYLKKNAQTLTFKEIKRHINDLRLLEYNIKSFKVDEASGVELYLLKV